MIVTGQAVSQVLYRDLAEAHSQQRPLLPLLVKAQLVLGAVALYGLYLAAARALTRVQTPKPPYPYLTEDVLLPSLAKGVTLAAASSLDKTLKGQLAKGCDKAAAAVVGKLVAERAVKAGVSNVVFDRGEYIYHGRVKALAEAAREAGLEF